MVAHTFNQSRSRSESEASLIYREKVLGQPGLHRETVSKNLKKRKEKKKEERKGGRKGEREGGNFCSVQ